MDEIQQFIAFMGAACVIGCLFSIAVGVWRAVALLEKQHDAR